MTSDIDHCWNHAFSTSNLILDCSKYIFMAPSTGEHVSVKGAREHTFHFYKFSRFTIFVLYNKRKNEWVVMIDSIIES